MSTSTTSVTTSTTVDSSGCSCGTRAATTITVMETTAPMNRLDLKID